MLQRDTLIRYLLDELHSYEISHGGALRPVKPEADMSFMGEHKDMQGVTFGDLKGYLHTVVKDVIDYMGLNSMHGNAAVTGTIISKAGSSPSLASGTAAALIDQTHQTTQSSGGHKAAITAPPPGTVIPRFPSDVAKKDRWKVIIKDWDFPDSNRGLLTPLKDWPPEWRNHPAFAMNHFNRRIVAEEFIDK